jgi:O-antigen/teichoic acid export membrane protein
MTSLSDKAGFLIAANFVKYAVGFVMPMLLVRLLTKADYGTYTQLQLIANVSTGVLVLGLPSSVYFFYQRDAQGRTALVHQTVLMLMISGVLTALVLMVGAPHFAATTNNPEVGRWLPLYAVSIGLGIASEHFVHFRIAQDRYASAVMFETGETIVRVAVCVVPLLLGYGLPGVIWCIVGMTIARFLLRQYVLLREFGLKLRREHFIVGEQLAYALPMCLTSVVGLVSSSLDRMIVAANFDPAQYALYTVGALEIPLDTIFQVAVANVLRASLPPLVREGRFDEIVRLVRESVRKLSVIMLPSFVFLHGFSQEFITLLFTKNYADSVAVFRIYLWLVPLHMMILSPIPQVFGRTRINLTIVAFVSAVHLVTSFLLLKWIGYLGPAISNVAAAYLIAALYFAMGVKLLRTSPLKLLPLTMWAKVIAAALVALFVCRQVFPSGSEMRLVQFALAGGLYAVCFLAAALALRCFTASDRQLAMRWAGRMRLLPR